MSTQNINYTNLDSRYSKPADVAAAISAQATTDAGHYAQKRGLVSAPVANRVWMPTTTSTYAAIGTGKSSHYAPSDIGDIQVGWANWVAAVGSGDTDNTNTNLLPIRAAIEYPAGTVTPLLFNGQRTGNLDNGATLFSDPVSVDVPAGAQFWIRTFVNPASGDKWPMVGNSGTLTGYTASEGEGFVLTSDLTAAGSGTIAQSSNAIFRPVCIRGRSTGLKSVAIIGDSIAAGQGDAIGYTVASPYRGFIARALNAANLAWQANTVPGEEVKIMSANHARRMPLISGCTSAIVQYGVNDIQASISPTPTTASVAGYLITLWRQVAVRVPKIWQTTITPNTTSTDGWATAGNQAISTSRVESARTGLNDWIRAGAPINPTTLAYAPVGTSGALLAGQVGHPLTGYFEIADIAETSRNSGIWQPAERYVNDGAISSSTATTTLTSATASFTSGDVGKNITVVGAGASAALLQGVITSVTNATTVILSIAASTTVSGAVVAINPRTFDGLHPQVAMHALMAAGINTSVLN